MVKYLKAVWQFCRYLFWPIISGMRQIMCNMYKSI